MARLWCLETVNIALRQSELRCHVSQKHGKSTSSDGMENILKKIRLNFGKSYVYIGCYKFSSISLSRDFMSFLSPSIIFGGPTRRNVFRWLHTGRVCMAGAYAVFLAKQAAEVAPTLSFENLGLGTTFIKSLRKAFPQVKNPTDAQAQLIPAVLGTRDIILKDVNGSGK